MNVQVDQYIYIAGVLQECILNYERDSRDLTYYDVLYGKKVFFLYFSYEW